MTGRHSWRSLQSVMVVTLHVAAVAYVVGRLTRPATLLDSFVWVPVTIGVAVFLSWPIGRAIGAAFDPGDSSMARTCPQCGRRDVRPLVRAGAGLFQPVSGYRCAACGTTFRQDGGTRVETQAPPETGPADPSGIEFLAEAVQEGEIRFLDEGAESET
jgi:hypothetical protein